MSRGGRIPGSPDWDLLVLGGGTAGIVAAKTGAGLGARVLLVESHRTGGDCLWTGCVPSKALIAAGDAAAGARDAGRFGVRVDGVRADLGAALAHVRSAVAQVAPVDSPEALERAGVAVRSGRGRFVGDGVVEIDGDPVSYAQAVLTTGAAPALPVVPGMTDVDVLTSETVWDLDGDPGRLAVLGGGSIGCELGQALARLDVDVTLVEGADRLLPREDPDASATLRRALEADGVDLRLGRTVEAVLAAGAQTGARTGARTDRGAGTLRLDDGSEVVFDRLLVAVGREPRTHDLGLAEVGVAVDERGFVVVDQHLRTTSSRIWAAGDLTGHPQLTHVAGVHGSLAASNAVLGVRRSVESTAVPRVTYTQPEVAAVGVDTGHVPEGVHVRTLDHEHVDRAVAEGRTDGFTRLAVDRRGRVVGATVVGPRAGESLGELVWAVRRGLRTRDLAGTVHAYPTWNDGPWNAALADVREQLARPATRGALRTLAAARRRWLQHGPGRRAD